MVEVYGDSYLRQCQCDEATTLEVANLLAEDTFLINFKMEELSDRLGLPEDFKKSNREGWLRHSSVHDLKGILDAWVSTNGCSTAKIDTLGGILKEMKLIAVFERLSKSFRPITAVVFNKSCRCAMSRTPQQQVHYTQNQQFNQYHNNPNFAAKGVLPGNSNYIQPMEHDDDELSQMFGSASIHSSRFSSKIKLYMHNLPEVGNDEGIVDKIVHDANIPEIADIDVKREEPKKGWWRGITRLAWGKDNKENPKPLKVKMKAKKYQGSTLNKDRIMHQLQNTIVCRQFGVEVRDNI